MYVIGTIRKFRTANFTVIVDAVEDECPDLSFDESGEVAADIDSGKLTLFCARARVIHKHLGKISEDFLGGCIYESLESFMDHKECGATNRKFKQAGDPARCGSYFAQMLANVCAEARQSIKRAQTIRVRS